MGLSLQTELELEAWQLTADWLEQYLAAVGDALPVYRETGLAPPLALAARTLGQLLDTLSLPAGAIHSLQELESLGPVRPGQGVRGAAHLERPRRRGNLEFRTVGYTLRGDETRPLLSGKTTVLIVQPSASPGEGAARPDNANAAQVTPATRGLPGDLPVVRRTITQAQLDAYCQVSGDHNPLHWDAQFAAGTQFGGIIAHGMLTLAFISEMLTVAFGRDWLERGDLKVRFKGAARPGAPVETWGRVNREEAAHPGRRVECLVGLRHAGTGEELVSGSAAVVVDHSGA